MEPTRYRFVDRVERRLVIASDDELELRCEVKEILADKPSGKLIAAGEPFDLSLGPPFGARPTANT